MKKLLLLLLTSVWTMQAQNIDSLRQIAQDSHQPDSVRWAASSPLVKYYMYRLPDSAQYFTDIRYGIAERTELKPLMAQVLFELGIYHERSGDYDQSLEFLTRSLVLFEELENLNFVANLLNSIGAIYSSKRENERARDYFLRSLDLNKSRGDQEGMAIALNNLGDIYRNLGDYGQALSYYGESLTISEKMGYQQLMPTTVSNVGFHLPRTGGL